MREAEAPSRAPAAAVRGATVAAGTHSELPAGWSHKSDASPAGLPIGASDNCAGGGNSSPAAFSSGDRTKQLRALLADGHSMVSAAREMGVSRRYARNLAAAAGLKATADASKRAVRAGARNSAAQRATRRRDAQRSAEERQRVSLGTLAALSARLGIDLVARNQSIVDAYNADPRRRADDIAREVGCTLRIVRRTLERARKSGLLVARTVAPAKRDLTPDLAAHMLAEGMRKSRVASEEEREALYKAQDHARRCAALPPVKASEADDLVARFLARGGQVTECPTMAAAPVGQGAGFAP